MSADWGHMGNSYFLESVCFRDALSTIPDLRRDVEDKHFAGIQFGSCSVCDADVGSAGRCSHVLHLRMTEPHAVSNSLFLALFGMDRY